MTKVLIILFSFFSTISFIQINENRILYSDTTMELSLLNEVELNNLGTLKVCFDLDNCKGFICEIDTTETRQDEMDIRAVITRLKEFEFKVEYKYRDSKLFLTDTFHLYCMNKSFSIALPLYSNRIKNDPSSIGIWDFFPASTDERDVVYCTIMSNQIVFYEKKRLLTPNKQKRKNDYTC